LTNFCQNSEKNYKRKKLTKFCQTFVNFVSMFG